MRSGKTAPQHRSSWSGFFSSGKPRALDENVRLWESLNTGEADEVQTSQFPTNMVFDAIDAHVIVRLQIQLAFPKIGIEHAVVADLNDVDPAPVAFVPGDFSARKAIDGRFLTDVFHCRGSGRRAARMLAPSGLMTIGKRAAPAPIDRRHLRASAALEVAARTKPRTEKQVPADGISAAVFLI
jgi:hypothetical protein